MKVIPAVFILLLIVNLAFSQSTVKAIDQRIQQVESSNLLKKTKFDASTVYDQNFDGKGVIEIFRLDHELVKAKEIIGLSRGRLTTTVFFDNQEPIMIREVQEIFPWNDNESSFDYTQLDSVFEAMIYLKNMQVIEMEQTGQRNIGRRTSLISKYKPTIKKIKQLANRKED